MESMLFTASAIFHQLEAHFAELLFVLESVVGNSLTLRTLKFNKIVLGHIISD